MKRIANFVSMNLMVVGLTFFTGCGQAPQQPAADSAVHAAGTEHSHEGWWCDEHGVPENVCAMCNSKLVPDFKAKGDWCKRHDRPDSECFVCHPELEADFAAQYEAKYGKKPPKPQG